MREECKICASYIPPETMYPGGLCEILLDRNVCSCQNGAYVIVKGCPLDKFGPVEEKEKVVHKTGIPYSMRRVADRVDINNLASSRL